jgi:hypothetical protein
MQFMKHSVTNLVYDCFQKADPKVCKYKSFATEPILSLKDWTKACQWSSLKKDITKYKLNRLIASQWVNE